MKKVLFIDRDGTITKEPQDEQLDSFEKLQFLPGVLSALGKISSTLDFELVMVTNQDGLGTEAFPESDFWPVQNLIISICQSEGIDFSQVCIDRSFPSDKLNTRKPGTGMLTQYITGGYDLSKSYVIGDRLTDMKLAKNLGAKGILINYSALGNSEIEEALDDVIAVTSNNWADILDFLVGIERTAVVERNTNETKIRIALNLEGGRSSINTGLKFFDHMLEQLAKHGGLGLRVKVEGDLEVDEHHTIEDCALALGEVFRMALGNKRGIQRYGFCLPMDDCLAQVAIDFGGRPWLVWNANFNREKIGDVPTEMFMHFFKSFSDEAQCNLNVQAEGANEHHKIEAIFKAWARAIKMAMARNEETMELPTTKGVL